MVQRHKYIARGLDAMDARFTFLVTREDDGRLSDMMLQIDAGDTVMLDTDKTLDLMHWLANTAKGIYHEG